METATPIPSCFICGATLRVRLTKSKKGKTGVELACPQDGRHMRCFVNDRRFVEDVVSRLAEAMAERTTAGDPDGKTLQNADPTPVATASRTRRRRA